MSQEKLKEFIKKKYVLLITDNGQDRTAWKKLCNDMGATITNILNTADISEALEIIETKKVPIVFCASDLKSGTGLDILNCHVKKCPDRSKNFFFFFSDKNSLAISSEAAEKEVDSIIIKPYNGNELQTKIVERLMFKVNLPEKKKVYYKIQEALVSKNLEQAEIAIQKYREAEKLNPTPLYLEGELHLAKGDIEKGQEAYTKSLKLDANHFGSLRSLFDLLISKKDFTNAYECASTLCEHYPINPKRIPDFLRVSIATKNYQDIITFCDMVLEIESDLPEIKLPLAAGLAIGSKYLAESKENESICFEASKKAIVLSDRKLNVLIMALESLIKIGRIKFARTALDETATADMGPELHTIDLVLTQIESNPEHSFNMASGLIKMNIKSPKIYDIYLSLCVDTGKNSQFLDDVIYDASKEFPDHKSIFERYRS